MKIITWNCQGAFRKKAVHIAAMRPDIAIIQECEPPDKLVYADDAVRPIAQLWAGEGKKGIGIFSYTEYTFELHESYEPSIQHCVPVQVNGPAGFNLLAVWTKEHAERKWSYVGQLYLGLLRYRDFLQAKDAFVIGDFNWNAIWDSPNRVANWEHLRQEMEQAQVTSYYHHFFREEFGAESRDTWFMYRKHKSRFHIDYCFGPANWLPYLRNVQCGDQKIWLSRSDHCPLIVELDLPSTASTLNHGESTPSRRSFGITPFVDLPRGRVSR